MNDIAINDTPEDLRRLASQLNASCHGQGHCDCNLYRCKPHHRYNFEWDDQNLFYKNECCQLHGIHDDICESCLQILTLHCKYDIVCSNYNCGHELQLILRCDVGSGFMYHDKIHVMKEILKNKEKFCIQCLSNCKDSYYNMIEKIDEKIDELTETKYNLGFMEQSFDDIEQISHD